MQAQDYIFDRNCGYVSRKCTTASRDADGFAAIVFAIYAHADFDAPDPDPDVTVNAAYIGLDGPSISQKIAGLPNLQEYFNDPFSFGNTRIALCSNC